MFHYESTPLPFDYSHLMDLAGGLRELTTDMSGLACVPETLGTGLGLGPTSFALVDVSVSDSPQIMALYSWGFPASYAASYTAESQIRQDVLTLCARIEDVESKVEQIAGHGANSRCAQGLLCPFKRPDFCGQCRQSVFTRSVDATHRMVLIVNHRPEEAGLSVGTSEAMLLVLNHLSKAIRVLLASQQYPPRLGDPFTRLTEREWCVLCDLNTEDGEKQIADRLGLSPHTLHSHIKSIYRKMDVQGRLPLLQKFQRALRDYRLRCLYGTSPASSAKPAVSTWVSNNNQLVRAET